MKEKLNNESLQNEVKKKELNMATAVLYHVQKSARYGYIFVSVAFVALFVIMAKLLMHQMDINQQNRR